MEGLETLRDRRHSAEHGSSCLSIGRSASLDGVALLYSVPEDRTSAVK